VIVTAGRILAGHPDRRGGADGRNCLGPRGALGGYDVRGPARLIEAQVVGETADDVGGVLGPAGQPDVDLGHGSVAVAVEKFTRPAPHYWG
jgi:hypothetical protein